MFKLSATGKETSLHTFDFPTGAWPGAPLLLPYKGYLHGTVSGGGSDDFGVVFKPQP